jgi:DNA repair protein RadC
VGDEHKDWEHAGGKLAELGPEALTDAELLSILVAPGTPGNSAEKIAENILLRFGSIERLGGLPLERLYDIKGMGDTKIIRLAAALEIARRAAYGILNGEKAQTTKNLGLHPEEPVQAHVPGTPV